MYSEATSMEVSPSKSIMLTNGELDSLIFNFNFFLPFHLFSFR